jgi:hypothetical protein
MIQQGHISTPSSPGYPLKTFRRQARIDVAIAYAEMLRANHKVYGKHDWLDASKLKAMTAVKPTVTITKVDGTKIKPDTKIKCANDCNMRKCPSFFKREFFHKMFEPPV